MRSQPVLGALADMGAPVWRGRPSPALESHRVSTHLGVEAIKGHDGPKEEERQVEVVLEQVS